MSSAHSSGVQDSMESRVPLPIKPRAMASHGSTLLLPQTHGLGGGLAPEVGEAGGRAGLLGVAGCVQKDPTLESLCCCFEILNAF